jgi:hypothetical protein
MVPLFSAMVELMQKDSNFPCFAALGEQTAAQLRDRFQPTMTHTLVGEYVDRLIDTSLGSHWTRLYDSVSMFFTDNKNLAHFSSFSINITRNLSYDLQPPLFLCSAGIASQ